MRSHIASLGHTYPLHFSTAAIQYANLPRRAGRIATGTGQRRGGNFELHRVKAYTLKSRLLKHLVNGSANVPTFAVNTFSQVRMAEFGGPS
jgi:hypothetical protein